MPHSVSAYRSAQQSAEKSLKNSIAPGENFQKKKYRVRTAIIIIVPGTHIFVSAVYNTLYGRRGLYARARLYIQSARRAYTLQCRWLCAAAACVRVRARVGIRACARVCVTRRAGAAERFNGTRRLCACVFIRRCECARGGGGGGRRAVRFDCVVEAAAVELGLWVTTIGLRVGGGWTRGGFSRGGGTTGRVELPACVQYVIYGLAGRQPTVVVVVVVRVVAVVVVVRVVHVVRVVVVSAPSASSSACACSCVFVSVSVSGCVSKKFCPPRSRPSPSSRTANKYTYYPSAELSIHRAKSFSDDKFHARENIIFFFFVLRSCIHRNNIV